MQSFAGGLWSLFGGLQLFADGLWSFVGGLCSFAVVFPRCARFVVVACFSNYAAFAVPITGELQRDEQK